MTSAAELAIMIRQTQAFVDADPEIITVTPATAKVPDGAGGHTLTAGTPFDAVVRLIPQSDKVPVVGTWEGTRAKVDYVLFAEPAMAADIMKDDTFAWRGQTWKVGEIHAKPDYAFKADVILDVG